MDSTLTIQEADIVHEPRVVLQGQFDYLNAECSTCGSKFLIRIDNLDSTMWTEYWVVTRGDSGGSVEVKGYKWDCIVCVANPTTTEDGVEISTLYFQEDLSGRFIQKNF